MIVKNEENFIRQCLSSLVNIVDEIIIVDTGSTDNTKEICKEFTPKIFDYEWNDHFADARNYSLNHANGDWILWLDADEILDEEAQLEIQKIDFCSSVNQFLLPIKIYYGEGLPVDTNNFYSYFQPRLFRNKIGFKFFNRIHENILLSNPKIDVVQDYVTITLYHYGYLKSIVNTKQKSERNLRLLHLENSLKQTNPWTDYHLASEYYNLQNYSHAFDYVNKAIVNFLMLNLKPPAILYRLKYAILIDTTSYQGSWPGIDKAVQLYPEYVDLHFLKGVILYSLGKLELALSTFQHCLILKEDHPDFLVLKGTGSFLANEYIDKCTKKLSQRINHVTKSKVKKILYIGWIGFNNLGDELMYELFKEKVNEMNGEFEIDVANYVERYLIHADITEFDLIVLGGGSIFSGPSHTVEPYLIDFLYNAIQKDKKVMIWGTGIDSLSKQSIGKLDTEQHFQQSISNELISKIKYVFSNSDYVGVRGPLTYNFFKKHGITENIHISGDSAFLMQLDEPKDKQKTIGINWGTTYNSLYGNNEKQVEEQLVSSINALIKLNYKIYLFVVWEPDIAPTEELFQKINNPEMVTLDKNLYSYKQIIPILNTFTFTINFKMHASYLSLAAQTPFIALGYRFKVYDFVKSIDMEKFIIPTDSTSIKKDILNLATDIVDSSFTIKHKMKQAKLHYTKKLMKPFEENLFL